MAEQNGTAAAGGQSAETPSSPCENQNRRETWGYDLYPERRQTSSEFSFKDWMFSWKGRENIEQYKCEKNVVEVVKKSPLIRLMVGALKKAGCPINFRRHIQCEHCEPIVTGGYDPVLNQIVICYNTSRSQGFVESVIVHEMIHMFDNCTREMDFKNIDHVACSEIRAANMTYCSYLSAFFDKNIPRSKITDQQKGCVRKRASDSVYIVRNVTREEADAAVDRVFDKCYNDMEPIGRRNRKRAADLAYSEGYLLGYD